MAPLDAASFVVGKTIPYFIISLASAIGIILVAMVLFGLPMRGSWLLLLVALSLFLVGALGLGLLISSVADNAAGGVPARDARVVPADADALRLHLSDFEHAGVPAGRHLCRARAVFSDRAARASC